MFKPLMVCLAIILGLLECRFWLSSDSLFKTVKLSRELRKQEQEVAQLARRNHDLLEHIQQLKADNSAIEEQARYQLGMVRNGETYYQVVEQQ